MPLLELQHVSMSFGGLRVLDAVNLHVEAEEMVGLIGPNGAGKTTVFNVISGLLKPDGGRVRFDGHDLVGLRPHQICHRGIGRTFQLVQPFSNMSVLDNVAAGFLFGRGRDGAVTLDGARAEAIRLLELVGLAGGARRPAGTLTLSERKRLEVSRAMATEPRLLLLDEVMAGLNPAEVEEMGGLIRLLRDETRVASLLIEHNMKFVSGLSNRVVVLNYGRVIAEGRPDDVVQNPEVIRAYLGERSRAATSDHARSAGA